jgi:predicted nucleotide-binding protein
MPSAVFKAVDKRYLINAYAENSTHGTMSAFESGFSMDSTEGETKVVRAVALIKWMYDHPDTDRHILELLNHLFVENPHANTTDANQTYVLLRNNVLRKRNIVLTDDGYEIGTQPSSATPHEEPLPPALAPNNSAFTKGVDSFMATTASDDSSASSRKVFVVHGRDMRPVHEIERFLLFLGMTMISWTDAVKLTNQSQPHTFDIVKAGMDNAGAIVVIFSPDDEARTNPALSYPGENLMPEGQARQNVLVEAGMAFAQSRSKTIFVQSERTRAITDLEGFNWVKLDGKWDSRQDFINRLVAAGAKPVPSHQDLTHRTAGNFHI